MNEEAIKLLYEDLIDEFDVGSLEEFTGYLSDIGNRQSFYDEIISQRSSLS